MELKERIAEELAIGIKQVGQRAHNEEELRIGVEKLLEPQYERKFFTAEVVYKNKT